MVSDETGRDAAHPRGGFPRAFPAAIALAGAKGAATENGAGTEPEIIIVEPETTEGMEANGNPETAPTTEPANNGNEPRPRSLTINATTTGAISINHPHPHVACGADDGDPDVGGG